jgi:hypothetical protein
MLRQHPLRQRSRNEKEKTVPIIATITNFVANVGSTGEEPKHCKDGHGSDS